ncbi:CsgG/HfaB family protein [Candidatus Omnitrophota bacterium]
MRSFLIILALSLVASVAMVGDADCASALKKTVAVFEFTNDSGYGSLGNIGQDFSMQLSDALMESKKFTVLTRKDLDVVFAEQDLSASGRMAKSKAAQTGKAIPAQILIKGQITEFQENTSGGEQGISIGGVSLGGKKSSAHVAVIVQLINSTTGEIVNSKRVEGEAKAGGFSIGYSGSFSIGTSNFKKTPLGKAVQMAIDRAVVYITKEMSGISWQGRVMLVKEGTIYVNSGENAGISSGIILRVYREGEALVDPETGIELGKENTKIGDIKITEVQEKFSKAVADGPCAMEVAKGDLVLE